MNNSYKDDSFGNIRHDYDGTSDLLKKYGSITPERFDSAVTSEYGIFRIHGDLNLDELSENLTRIGCTIPAIIRIFERPIIQLDETDEVLPIEAANKINNKSLLHLASHSELWKNTDGNSVMPEKLLTRKYLDNYSIYENIVFACTVDCVLSYLYYNLRTLRYMMYTGRTVEFNMLDKVNHINYYYALGKLHIGYIRDFNLYYDRARSLYGRISRIYDALAIRLKYRVYAANKDKHRNLKLHSTNILSMQKDYRRMYGLLRYMKAAESAPEEIGAEEKANILSEYALFCKILLIFSIQHFGFTCPGNIEFNFEKLNAVFEQNGWRLSLSDCNGGILMELEKEKKYGILFTPSLESKPTDSQKPTEIDELLTLSPLTSGGNTLFISRTELDSFRRIQQVILRGMIYADGKYDVCPFCGGVMKPAADAGNAYLCSGCNNLIRKNTCPTSGEDYFTTEIKDFMPDRDSESAKERLAVSHDPGSELYCYRNVTKITPGGKYICPKCGYSH